MKTSIALDKHCAIGAERDTSNNVDETLPSKRVATMFTVFVIVPNRANALVVHGTLPQSDIRYRIPLSDIGYPIWEVGYPMSDIRSR